MERRAHCGLVEYVEDKSYICPLQSFDVFVQEKGDEKLGLGTEEEGGRWMGRNRGGGDERGEMRRRMG